MRDHIMIDLETLGSTSSPNCVVLSIGATKFDPMREDSAEDLSAEGFHIYLDPQEQLNKGIGVDWSTILWWHQQEVVARTGQFGERVVRTNFAMFAGAFKEYVGKIEKVWGNGPSFDCSILGNLYKKFGFESPFKYYNERCVRTIGEAAGLKKTGWGTAHDALDDAVGQAVFVQRCYKKLEIGA